MTLQRIENVKKALGKYGYDALAVNAGPTMAYLTGLHFHLMERPVVLIIAPEKEPVLILPELELAKLKELTFTIDSFGYPESPDLWPKAFKAGFQRLDVSGGKIAVERSQMRLLEYQYLQESCPQADWVDGSIISGTLRSIKDEGEIAAMKKAVNIAEEALKATIGMIGIGVTERDIAAELFLQLIKHGSETTLPFSPIVAGGPNSANPHASPSARKLAAGDLLVIDWGACWGGYASDLTRTFGIGEVGNVEKEIHLLVQQANEAGRLAGGPGVACGAVDDAARACIEKGGYGSYFTHRTGHGLGMECHEEPYIRSDNRMVLQPGMTYTVEPGIYLPDKNGVRIEDDVVVTESGAESLSTLSRELQILG